MTEKKDNDPEQIIQGMGYFFKSIAKLWHLIEGHRNELIFVTMTTVVYTILDLLSPYFMSKAIEALTADIQENGITPLQWSYEGLKTIFERMVANQFLVAYLGFLAVVMLSMFYVHNFVREIRFAKVLITLENDWPKKALKKLLYLSKEYHEQENTGKKIGKISKGIERLVQIIGDLHWKIIPCSLYITCNMVFLCIMSWHLALIFAVPFCIALVLATSWYKKNVHEWYQWDVLKEEALGYFHQSITNYNTVMQYAQEEFEYRRHEKVRDDMKKLDIRITNKQIKELDARIGLMLRASYYATICISVVLALGGVIKVSVAVYFMLTGGTVTHIFWELLKTYMHVIRYLISVERFDTLMQIESTVVNEAPGVFPSTIKGEIRFQNITFSYPTREGQALKDFSLSLSPNKFIALAGSSGEGKSTIIKLLTRTYDVTGGEITLDGTPIRSLDLYRYRRLFAVVAQETQIFDATLRENVAYPYPEASEEDIARAIQIAHLDETIKNKSNFPEGILTQVGERGAKLSGGEAQRVSIARAVIAILNGARYLVLDEATASLDTESERDIQDMIHFLRQERNVGIVAIAHRLSTIEAADTIFVIQDGMVLEKGTHSQLIEQNGRYATFALGQSLR